MIHTRRPVSLVFDEGNLYRHQFEHGYSIIRRNPHESAQYLGALTFASDERAVPLQAADLFAWTVARYTHEIHVEKRATASAPWTERVFKRRRRVEYLMSREEIRAFHDTLGFFSHEDTPLDQKKLNRFLKTFKPRSEE